MRHETTLTTLFNVEYRFSFWTLRFRPTR